MWPPLSAISMVAMVMYITYRLDHSKRDLIDIDTLGKSSPKMMSIDVGPALGELTTPRGGIFPRVSTGQLDPQLWT